jgi:hypothetical protein
MSSEKSLAPIYTYSQIVRVLYRNWKGEIAWRRIVQMRMEWSQDNAYHKDQWLLRCWDLDKEAERSYSCYDMLTQMIPETHWIKHRQTYEEYGEVLRGMRSLSSLGIV